MIVIDLTRNVCYLYLQILLNAIKCKAIGCQVRFLQKSRCFPIVTSDSTK